MPPVDPPPAMERAAAGTRATARANDCRPNISRDVRQCPTNRFATLQRSATVWFAMLRTPLTRKNKGGIADEDAGAREVRCDAWHLPLCV